MVGLSIAQIKRKGILYLENEQHCIFKYESPNNRIHYYIFKKSKITKNLRRDPIIPNRLSFKQLQNYNFFKA
jgi:hypothetical protein